MDTRRRRALIETFEPRIMYSADPGPAGLAAAVLTAAELQVDGGEALQGAGAELVFIDARVPELQLLLDDLAAQQQAGRAVEVVVVGVDEDGVAVIGEHLAGRSDVAAIHLIGHGADGVAELGAGRLDAASLVLRAGEISAWGDALTAGADLLIYGCDVASTPVGEGLVDALAALTGADVAASDDPTGAASLGGDWDLEYRSGSIERALAPGAETQEAWGSVLAISANGTVSSANNVNTNVLTWSHTVASGTDRALFVEIAIGTTGTFASNVTYGGTAMTLVGRSSSGTVPVEIWRLLNPAVGTADVVVSLSANTPIVAGATTYNGVNQTSPVRSFYSASGNSMNSSVTVADSVAGDLVIDVQSWAGQPPGGAVGAGQTLSWSQVNTFLTGGSTSEPGAASVVMSGSFSSSAQWVIGAVAIRPSAGITVTPISGLTVTEAGGTAQFSVVLDTAPTANVTIGLTSSDTTEGTLSASTLTFTPANWNVAQTVTVTGVNDSFVDGNVLFSIVTAAASSIDASYNGRNASDVSLTNTDDDTFNTLVVDTASDDLDGTTTSIAALLANKGADGKISLREAITAANNTANGPGGADRILFSIAGSGPHSIALGSVLPVITEAVIIDGSSEPDFAGTPVVELNGTSAGTVADSTHGLVLGSGSSGSTIKGLAINRFAGSAIQVDSGSGSNLITGNYLGTDTSGLLDQGNGKWGIDFLGSGGNNVVGGTTAALRNVIAGNDMGGIAFNGATVTGNVVLGNYIGVGSDGATALANGSNGGFLIFNGATVRIGGVAAGEGNLIAYNSAAGITVPSGMATILGNRIFGNSALGIDLDVGGVTANDLGDADTGSNNLQNYPEIGSVVSAGGNTTVTGTLRSNASTTYRLEFFSSASGDATGYGEGQTWLGATTVTTDAAGYASFSATFSGIAVSAGYIVSATATVDLGGGSYGATSEFSANRSVNTDASFTAAQDTYINGNNPTLNYGASGSLVVDYSGGSIGDIRALLQFDLSSLPSATTIASATLQMTATGITGPATNLNVYQLTESWVEGSGNGTVGAANWTERQPGTAWSTAGGSFNATVVASLSPSATGLHSWDLTALVRSWVSGATTNNGLIIGSPDGGGQTITYDSSEGTTPPVLVISYSFVANTAPVLDASKSPVLTSTTEDAGAPSGAVGTLVSGLVDFASPAGQVDNVTDADSGALTGIAVTATNTSGGSWWYSTNNGSSWLEMGSVSEASARLLSADAGTRLYFQPSADWNGSLADAITFRAWDRSNGANGGLADTTSSGGATAFSSVSDAASLTVSAVNDAPVVTTTATPGAYVENASTVVDAGLTVADVDGGNLAGATVSITGGFTHGQDTLLFTNQNGITGSWNGQTGVLTLSGSATVADYQAALRSITYSNASDSPSTTSRTVSFTASDGTASSNTATRAITIASTNDAPTFDAAEFYAGVDIAGAAERGQVVLVQPDGKILVAGHTGSPADFLLVRYNADGSLDTSFGGGDGIVTTAISSGEDKAYGITLQADGKIIVVGESSGANQDFAMVRYNIDGSLDTSFGGGDGIVTTDFAGGSYDAAYRVIVQPDGRIVVGGASSAASIDFAVARYLADGSLDTTFSGDGKQTTDMAGSVDEGFGLALDASGRIVQVGGVFNAGQQDFGVVRYNTDGSLDTTFSGDGKLITAVGSAWDIARDVAVQAGGRIVVGGYYRGPNDNDVALIGLNDDGTLDGSFGNAGVVTTDLGNNESVWDLALQPDGRIVVVGGGGGNHLLVARYLADGSADTSFSGDGNLLLNRSSFEILYAVDVAPDGRIVAAGYGSNATEDLAVLRLAADGTLDTRVATGSSLGGTANYTENGPAVVIDATVRIFDAELSAADSFNGATLSLARSGGASTQDVFAASGNLAALIQGQALVLGGVTVGQVVTNSGGTLSLSFNDNATQARINEVMSSITYANTSEAPPASVQLDWAFSDGNAGSQGSGGALGASGSSTVNTTAVNDAPVITFVSGNANYPENAGPVIVAPSATVSDVDSADFNGGRLVVYFSANGQPEDRIAIRNQGTGAGLIGVNGSDVTYGGVVIGTWSGGASGATPLIVSFNANATSESVQALGRNITYENVSDAPSSLVRTMVGYLEDGDGGTSNTVGGTLTIVPANDAPVVAITPPGYAATEQVVLTLSGTGMSVSDADAGTAVLRATLTVASGTLSAGAGSTGVMLAGSGSSSLTVDGTVAQINAFLAGSSGASLSYLIDTDAPPASDTFTLAVDDLGYSGGPAQSGADTATINITAVNDGPINHIPGAQVTAVNTALVMSAANGNGLSITDADAGSGLMRILLTTTNGTLTLGSLVGLSSAVGNGTASVSATGTQASINAALDGLRFTPASGYSGTASFVIETSDEGNSGGGALTDTDTVFVKVGASRYQQGVDGYTGTEDTYVSDGATTTSYGNATTVVTDDGAPVAQGLLRFGNLFGSGVGQIPYGAVINSVALSFYVTNTDANDSVSIYRMLAAWDENSTWNSLGSGVSFNGVEAASSADVTNWDAGISGWNTITSGLTASVQAWANGATNNGWVFSTPSVAADKWTFASSEYATVSQRPYLVVSYTPPAPPVITSNGGGATASVNVAENSTYVTTVTATDADSAQGALSYAITGGADADKFSINASGVLSFKVAPDYEAPGDIGANRVYDLTVRVSDGYVADTQDIAVTVTAVNEAPALGGLGGSVSHTEGGAATVLAGTATVSDPELSAANSFDGATLTLARSGGASAEDIFSATGRLGTLTAGQSLVLDGAVVGTVSTNGGGTLGLSFNASATQARIDEVLRSIAYANSADAPPGSVQIRWTFSDGNTGGQGTGSALTAVGSTTVNITAVNDPAVIGGADTASLTETNAAQSTGGTLTISDVDSAASFVAQSNVSGSNGYGNFSIASNGVWSYTMGSAHNEFDAGLTYTDSFTVAAADGTTHLITVSITGTNDVSSLSSGSASLTETDAVQNTGGALTLTDADTTDATVVAQANTAGTYGRFSIDTAGVWTYTTLSALDQLDAGQIVSDVFTVATSDGGSATVTVSITGTNDVASLSSGSASLTETDAVQNTGGTLTLTDADSTAATVVAQTDTTGTYGRFSIDAAGIWTYTTLSALDSLDAGQVVSDVFTVATSDGGSATVTVSITGTNDIASLGSGSAALTETDAVQNTGGTLTITDADSTAATVIAQTNTSGTYGRFSVDAAGAWTYTTLSALDALDAGQVVSDVFTVTTSDGSTATVTVSITGTNDVASLSSGSAALTETDAVQNTGGTLTLTDADSIDATVVAQTNTAGTYGRFSIDTAGLWTYTTLSALDALDAGQVVTDVFTVATSDGGSATVTVSITGSNDVASLSSGSAALTETDAVQNTGGTLTITDADSTDATVVAQTNTSGTYGRFSIDAAGAWTYTTLSALDTLDAGQVVSDVFTVTTSDGSTATVTITITGSNDVASLSSGSASLTETDAVQNTGGTLTLTDADTTAATVTPQSNTTGTYGRFSVDAAGAWSYTTLSALDQLDAGQVVSDVFTVATSDGGSATVTITITGTNDIASLGSGSAALTETDAVQNTGGALTITDADTTDATVVAQTNTAGTYGRFSIDAAGAWTYTTLTALDSLDAGQVVSDVFTVATSDGGSATVTITITGSNDVSSLSSGSAALTETDAVQNTGGTLTLTDADTTDATVVAQTNTSGTYGRFSIDAAGIWTYTTLSALDSLDAGQVVTDVFTVATSDGGSATVTIAITGTNDIASLGSGSASLTETDSVQNTGGTLTLTDADSTDATVVAQTDTTGTYGRFSIDTAGLWTYTTLSALDALDAGQVVTDVFTVATSDGGSAMVTVTITGTNDVASLSSDIAALIETDAVQNTGGTLALTDADTTDATVVAQTNTAGTYGRFSIDAAGAWTYTTLSALDQLDAGQVVSDVFTVATSDGGSATVTITITGSNDVASLSSDIAALTETDAVQNTGGTLTLTDADTTAATVTPQTNTTGTYGRFSIDAAGVWTYTTLSAFDLLDAGQVVSDVFTVATSDGGSATVTITITGTNDVASLSSDIAALTETDAVQNTGGTLTITDADTTDATVVAQADTAGTYGRFSIDAAGVWTYTTLSAFDALDAGQVVTDVFTVATSDGGSATVTIAITGSNDVASLSSGIAALTETDAVQNTGGTLTLTDADTTAATVAPQANTAGTYGRFSIDSAGAWTYTTLSALDALNAGQVVSDVFTVATSDGGSATVAVSITGSNDVASLSSDIAALTETDAVQSTGGTLTLTDADTTDATVVAQTNIAGTYGQFSIDSAGAWTYTTLSALDPLDAGQIVSDVFTVATSDGGSATVTVTITGTNDVASLSSDTASLTETDAVQNTGGTLTLTDADTTAATVTPQSDTAGTYGRFSVDAAGAWTYTTLSALDALNAGQVVSDVFTVATSDGGSATVTVSITGTNDAPTAVADTPSTAEDTPISIDASANDIDLEGNALAVVSVTQGAHGSVSVAGGVILYTPDANFHGADSFSYLVSDGQGGAATATVSVTVTPVNDQPQATDDVAGVAEDTPLTGSVAGNDSPSGDGGNVWSLVAGPGHGSLVLAGDGSFRYTPDPDFHGTDSFTYALTDADGDRVTASATIVVAPVNDAPVLAGGASVALNSAENSTAVTTLVATDVDRPAQALAYRIVGGADQALFSVDALTGELRFIAAPDHDAPADADRDNLYELVVQVSDGLATASQTLSITVDNRNEMPQGSDGRIGMAEDGQHRFTLADFGFRDDLDKPANSLAAVQIVALPGQGVLQLAGRAVGAGEWVAASQIAAGLLVFQPAPDANGNDYAALVFRVRDDGGLADGGIDTEAGTHTLSIDVAAVNDAPSISRVAFELPAGTSVVLGAAAVAVSDVDSALASLSYTVDTASAGHFEFLGSPGQVIAAFSQADLVAGRVVFVHDAANVAPVVVLHASDGQAGSDTVTATITLQVSAPATPTGPAVTPPTSPVTVVTPVVTKPVEAEKPTKSPATINRPVAPEGAAATPASPGTERGGLGQDAAGNADTGSASRTRSPVAAGALRLEREPIRLTLGVGIDGPLMDFMLRSDSLGATTSSSASLRVAEGNLKDSLQDKDGEVDVRVVLQAIELTGVALSVGAVWWATRAGALVASLLVSVPAWRSFDPLMVLGPEDEDDRDWAGVMDDRAVQDEMGIADVFDAKSGEVRS